MKVKKILISLCAVGILATPFYLTPRLVTIKKVRCASQFGPCNSQISSQLDLLSNGKLAMVRDEIQKTLDKNVLVKEYFVQFSFPNEIKVDLLEAKPKYALKDKNNKILLVDERGIAITQSSLSSLPTVEIDGVLPEVAEEVDEKFLFAAEIIYDMFSLYGIDKGAIVADSLELHNTYGVKILFPLEGDRQVLLGSLVLILSRLNTPDEITKINEVSEIDLRYKNPVLR